MNINDVLEPLEKPENMLEAIFKHQHALALKYLPIEKSNGLLLTDNVPVNIHNNRGQARLKDMTWRCVEEIAEAFEAAQKAEYLHFYEEMADAMHFLVELCILADVYPSCEGNFDDLENHFDRAKTYQPVDGEHLDHEALQIYGMDFVVQAGLACNCLKNKPWKTTHMMTDTEKFNKCLRHAFTSFIELCKVSGFTAWGLYQMYMRKHEVNVFRQRSGY